MEVILVWIRESAAQSFMAKFFVLKDTHPDESWLPSLLKMFISSFSYPLLLMQIVIYSIIFILAVPRDLQDPSSLTRGQTRAPGSESSKP